MHQLEQRVDKDVAALSQRRILCRSLLPRARERRCGPCRAARWWSHVAVGVSLLFSVVTTAGEVRTPPISPEHAITIEAEAGSRWQEGEYEVWSLEGGCRVAQGQLVGSSHEAIIWINRADPGLELPSKVIVYLEDQVTVDFGSEQVLQAGSSQPTNKILAPTWMGQLFTVADIHVRLPNAPAGSPPSRGLVQRADAVWQGKLDRAVKPAQFLPPLAPGQMPPQPPPSARSLRIASRSSVPLQWKSYPGRTPEETVAVISGGVLAVVGGIQNVEGLQSDTVTLEADRVVVWTNSLSGLSGANAAQTVDGRWEFYLEGNIIYREGDRLIYADRMYYNVTDNFGTILNAEMLTPVPEYEGLMRLKADVLQQVNEQNFLAYGAALTSSRMGVPRYWAQSSELALSDVQTPVVDPFTGQNVVDPNTGDWAVDHQMLATSRNNFLYVGGFPVFYWPVLATNLEQPTFYLDRIRLRNDNVFGTQVLLDWDMYQVLGIREPPENTKWLASTDWLSDRGLGLGTYFGYECPNTLWCPGPTKGFVDAWGIDDTGLDNLGANRRALIPEHRQRGRVLWNHRQYLANGFQWTGQVGYIRERNTLESYYEPEWDLLKDQTTGLQLKQYVNNQTWSITSDVRLNDFFTQTEWLPRFDHTLLGQSLLADRLTWHAHTHVGYGKLQIAAPPEPLNPSAVEQFHLLAWEVPSEGLHTATRHELDLPLDLGPTKVVPYILGEAFYVGQDLDGEELTRVYGQAGVRASLPFWRVDPTIQSELFNVRGLAHKIVFDADLFLADANQNLDDYPLYENLDDDAVEFFRRTFLSYTFAGEPAIPLPFDERYYALRWGMQNRVVATSTEIADDLAKVELGVRQRWQTKRGLPGQERIVDWITLDIEGSFFPDPDRDNFGADVGLVNYDFRWHLGDRVTLLSDGYADFFSDGLRTVSLGGVLTRPARGNLFLGIRSIEGPISSNILSGSLSYRMSEKWILTAGAMIDFGDTGNIGETLALTRIGESTLVQLGINVDESRDSVGVSFTIEPRFLASDRLGYVGGVQIPPAGSQGLE